MSHRNSCVNVRHPKTVAGQTVGASSFAVESSDLHGFTVEISGREEAKMDKSTSELDSKHPFMYETQRKNPPVS